MSYNYHNYQLLLKEAAQLYKKYEVGRPELFNIFSVLFKDKETDEVNLHSRFLHALLDYRKPGSETRENLKDFLQHVGVEDFELCNVKVERERYYIDILITNDKQAVVIENKIGAKDQDKQLWRYYNTLQEQHYLDSDIHLLYLTLEGHHPSENSACGLPYKTISYKDDLSPWLERCQKRAYDESALRGSVTQYLQLVRKLTGTDFRRRYMDALKKLCLENSNDVSNFVLIHDLNEARIKAWTELSKVLWKEIESYLKDELISEIPDLLTKGKEHSYKWDLYYQLSKAVSLQVGTVAGPESVRMWFGVGCSKKEYEDKYDKLNIALEGLSSEEKSNNWCPWWRYTDTGLFLKSAKDFKLLLNDTDRQEHAKETAKGIVKGLKDIWEIIEDIALINAIKEGE